MTRIAHLTTVHNVRDPRIFRKELSTLGEAGYETHLIAPHVRDETIDGIRVHSLNEVTGRYRRLVLLGEVYRRARRLDAALYHFHDPELIPVGWALQRATGAHVVYDMHEDYWWKGCIEGPLIRLVERWCFRWVDHVIVANEAHQQIPAKSGADVTLIANYATPAVASERGGSGGGGLELVYTGVISQDRGLGRMLSLAAAIQRRELGWRVNIVGICNFPDEREEAAAMIRENDLSSVVRRTAWDTYVPWDDLMRWCQSADVGLLFIEPTEQYLAPFPTKLYEYISAGLPVLCHDMPHLRAFVEEHDCGAVVEPGDVDGALQILERWQKEPDLYAHLSRNARRASRQYRWEIMGERLVRLYERLIGPPVCHAATE